MNEMQGSVLLTLGFRLIDEENTLAETHGLIFDPPEGYDLTITHPRVR